MKDTKFTTHLSAIMNIDSEKSFTRTLRSPEKNIQNFINGTKMTVKNNF
jgi:hypothetical protein